MLGETHTPQFATILSYNVTSSVVVMIAHKLLTEGTARQVYTSYFINGKTEAQKCYMVSTKSPTQ